MIVIFEIIAFIVSTLGIFLEIYSLFIKKSDNPVLIKQRNLFINPTINIYNASKSSGFEEKNNYDIENKKWVSHKIISFVMLFIIFLICYRTFSFSFDQNSKNLIEVFYYSIGEINMFFTLFLMAFSIVILAKGWSKNLSIYTNLKAMKVFSLKILSDILIFPCTVLFNNVVSTLFDFSKSQFYLLGLYGFIILFQMVWLDYILKKLFEILPESKLYKDKLNNLLMFVPIYIMPLLFIIIYYLNI